MLKRVPHFKKEDDHFPAIVYTFYFWLFLIGLTYLSAELSKTRMYHSFLIFILNVPAESQQRSEGIRFLFINNKSKVTSNRKEPKNISNSINKIKLELQNPSHKLEQ